VKDSENAKDSQSMWNLGYMEITWINVLYCGRIRGNTKA